MTAADRAVNGFEILAFLVLVAAGIAAAVLAVVVEKRDGRRKREAGARLGDQAAADSGPAAAAPQIPEPAPDDGGWLADGLDEALRRITEGQS